MKRSIAGWSWIVVVVGLAGAVTLMQWQRSDAKDGDPPNPTCMKAAEATCEQEAKDLCRKKRGPAQQACESAAKEACMAVARKAC